MERLTDRELYDGKVTFTKCQHTNCSDKCSQCEIPKEAEFKLKEYEDLEEQGLLKRMPCTEGDKVFVVGTKCLADMVTDEECEDIPDCEICQYDKEYVVFERVVNRDLLFMLLFGTNSNFIWGKTVFDNKKDADKALEEKQ